MHSLFFTMEDIMDAPQCCWMPESILVLTAERREPIDIVPYLINDQDEYASLKNERKRLEFHADVFPPSCMSVSYHSTAFLPSMAFAFSIY
jgi:hypothetical protein